VKEGVREATIRSPAIQTVLFDWGDTLMQFSWDDDFVAAGHRAGMEAIGRPDLPDAGDVTAHFLERYHPFFWVAGSLEELEYPQLVRDLLRDVGVEISADELDRYLEAEHEAWGPAAQLGSTTHALLESLRNRGLKLGIVSNAFDPGWLLHRDLERAGVAERVDFAVFSSELGVRKPHPRIFEVALDALATAPENALFVGDRLDADVAGAKQVGMTTVQALWFRADEAEGPEPDFQAFTQMDVLNVVRRLNGES
jgi:putative hydrolase of the HAD superfamily